MHIANVCVFVAYISGAKWEKNSHSMIPHTNDIVIVGHTGSYGITACVVTDPEKIKYIYFSSNKLST